MKKYLILFVLILIQGCSSDGDSGTATATNSLLGTWAFVYQSSGCIESYAFNSNGTWSESALDERQTGTYTFDETVNAGERHALSILVTSDNGLPDCEGNSSDATGVTGTIYVSFPNVSVMEWYLTLTGGIVEIILTKQ